MDLSSLVAKFRNQTDPETRSQALAEIALAANVAYNEDVVLTLIEALGDEDTVVQEWVQIPTEAEQPFRLKPNTDSD